MLSVVACVVLAACTQKAPETPAPADQDGETSETLAVIATAQGTVNRYFHASVVSKLRGCWRQVQGEGAIGMTFSYARSGDTWALTDVTTHKSTLPEDQTAIALRCMLESSRGMSLPLTEKERSETTEGLVLKWTWLVPLPEEGSEAMERRIGLGEEPEKGCAKCISNVPARCVYSEKGAEGDCRVEGPNACSTTGKACLTGLYGRQGRSLQNF